MSVETQGFAKRFRLSQISTLLALTIACGCGTDSPQSTSTAKPPDAKQHGREYIVKVTGEDGSSRMMFCRSVTVDPTNGVYVIDEEAGTTRLPTNKFQVTMTGHIGK